MKQTLQEVIKSDKVFYFFLGGLAGFMLAFAVTGHQQKSHDRPSGEQDGTNKVMESSHNVMR